MQKTTSTIVIAFLSGLVVALGAAYVVTTLHKPAAAPMATVATTAPAPVVVQQPPAPTSQPVAEPVTAPEETAAAEPAPAPQAKRKKPRPTVEGHHRKQDDEAAPAPQPVQAEVAQNVAPAAPVPIAPQEPAKTTQPAQALNPPPGTQTAPPPPREPRTITLNSGTPITVRINEKISTNTNYAGDTFTASLDHPVIVDGFVIADRGSRVIGKVLKADKAGRVKGLSELSLVLTQIHTTDGQTVAIETVPWDKEGPTSKKRDAAEVAGGAALGAIIGAIAGGGKGAAIGAGAGGAAGTGAVMTTRGKPAEIDSETRITFSLSNNVPITEHLNQ